MRSLLTGRTRRYLDDAAGAFERAPVEVATAVVLAIAFSYAVEAGDNTMLAWFEVAVGAVLVMTAAWTATLLHAVGRWTAPQRWGVTLAGAVAAAAYAILVVDFERAAEGWRAAMLTGAAVLWLVAVPAVAAPDAGAVRSDDVAGGAATDRMRLVTGRILLRVVGALLYCGALFLGLALALGAVDTLFELNLDGNIYGHVFGWIFVVLAPWIVVGGLADYTRPAAQDSAVAGVVKRMASFLVPPLLALYYLILYAYTIRIAMTGEVPKNLVSPLVFAAGVLAALGLLLFDPRSREATAFRTLRAAPPLFLPLAALGIWAITQRVSQYGWTEFRLLRLVLLVGMALLALGATAQIVRRRRLSLHLVPLTAAALLLLAAIGPWSVQSTARRSQQARLQRALVAAGVDPQQRTQPAGTRTLRADTYDDLTGAALYLGRHFGSDALPPVIAVSVTEPGELYDIGRRLGLERAAPTDMPRPPVAAHLPVGVTVQVDGVLVRRVLGRAFADRGPDLAPDVVQDSGRLRIRGDGEQFTADLAGLAASLRAGGVGGVGGRPSRPGELLSNNARLDVFDAAGRRRGSLLILDLFLEFDGDAYRLMSLDGLLLLDASTGTTAARVP